MQGLVPTLHAQVDLASSVMEVSHVGKLCDNGVDDFERAFQVSIRLV
jgi:hypothetical protein